jgi:hypothetical protein
MNRLSFSDDMMWALAAGAKTMTRRPEKRAVPPSKWIMTSGGTLRRSGTHSTVHSLKPRFRIGELVAATCAFWGKPESTIYRFNTKWCECKWAPARIMPAALAPFMLRITEVRAERLGEITDADAVREGMLHWVRSTITPITPWNFADAKDIFADIERAAKFGQSYRDFFAAYWRELYGPDAWYRDRDSWVWVYGFAIEERRIG